MSLACDFVHERSRFLVKLKCYEILSRIRIAKDSYALETVGTVIGGIAIPRFLHVDNVRMNASGESCALGVEWGETDGKNVRS